MTHEDIKLEILKAMIPAASRHGLEKAQIIQTAQEFFDFVVKPPAKDSTETLVREPKKK